MTDSDRPDLQRIVETYREAFARNGLDPASVLMPKGRQDVRFGSLCRLMRPSGFSVLDFGSGLGDLAAYMNGRFSEFRYSGVDIVEEFVETSARRFPEYRFLRINDAQEVSQSYDYVVTAGVFNMLYFPDEQRHKAYVYDTLRHLFSRCTEYLAVNFMTELVDFRQPGSYHQDRAELCDFATRDLSRRWLLDQSYMPYEFTLVVFRDAYIERPSNTYRPLQCA